MDLFTSKQERRLWLWVLIVQTAIFATLGLAGKLASRLGPNDLALFSAATLVILAVLVAASIWAGSRPSRRELGMAVGIVAAYAMAFIRMGFSPAERTHLFEYGIVAALIHQALLVRACHGRRVPTPALLAVAFASLLGTIDEGLQFFIPNRVFDPRDVMFNAFAASMAVATSKALSWARKKKHKHSPSRLDR